MDVATERVEWDEVVEPVEPIIKIWVAGSELGWAEYAWDVLAGAGLTGYSSESERVRCVLRAVALGALCRDFSARAFDEGSPGDWTERIYAQELVGPPPLVSEFTLGQLAERDGVEVDDDPLADGDRVVETVLCDMVRAQYLIVWQELRTRVGDAELFAGLFASSGEDTSYPLAGEQVSAIVNDDITGNKAVAWEWLTQS